jgi:predicted transcriptional regulator
VSGKTVREEQKETMAIIKAPPKQPKAVTMQARVEESVKTQLDQYAKFIASTPSYVITEALKLLFKRDDEFKAWVDKHANGQKSEKVQGEALAKTT